MNRAYSLVWNRALHSVQVASELATSAGGGNAATGEGSNHLRRHPLALACVAALALGAFALPARSASCTIHGVSYTYCKQGTNGGNGVNGWQEPGVGEYGGKGGTGSNPGYNNGGAGIVGGNGGAGQGVGGSGGGGELPGANADGGTSLGGGNGGHSNGFGGGGGGGGGLNDGGVGGGGGGGGGNYSGGVGGGGGGGGLGLALSASTMFDASYSVVGGSGGVSGSSSGGGTGGTGGGGGGGSGVLLSAGTLTNQGGIAGGNGGGIGRVAGGAGGGGGAGILLDVGTRLANAGVVAGGNGGNGGKSSTGNVVFSGNGVGGAGGSGVAGHGFVLTNTGRIFGGSGGVGGSSTGGAGGAGVFSTGGASIVTNGSIAGGLSGAEGPAAPGYPGGYGSHVQADAVDFSGGGNTLTLEVGSTATGNIVSTSGANNGGDTLILGDDTLGSSPTVGGSNSLAINSVSGFSDYYKTGTSTWTLTGANADTSPWNVQGGALIVGDATATASLAGAVTVDSGATLGGYGSVGTAGATPTTTTVKSGGVLAPGSSTSFNTTGGTFGTFTVNGNLVLASGSIVQVNLGAPNATAGQPGAGDDIQVNGDLTLGGVTLNVANVGGMGPGLYNVISYAGTQTGTGLSVGSGSGVPAGQKLTLQYAPGQINLVDAFGTLAFWAPAPVSPSLFGGSGTWTSTSDSWTDATGAAPLAPMSPVPGFAEFEGTPGTVTVDSSTGEIDVTGMQFFVPRYSVVGKTASDTVTLVKDGAGNAPVINVGDGTSASATTSATIDAVLAGTDGLTKTDLGTLVLAGANILSGGMTVNGGALEVATGGTLGTGVVTVNGGTGMNSTLAVDSGAALANHIVLNSSATSMDDCTTSSACATLNNAGTLNDAVDNSTVVSADGYAVVSNTGTISGVRSGVNLGTGGSVINSGAGATIMSSSGTSGAIDISGSTGTVTNSGGGHISGSFDAVDLNHGGSVTNDAASVITGAVDGLAIGGGVGTVSNGGAITAGLTGVTLDAGSTLSNTGTGVISAQFGAYLAAGGAVSNAGTIGSGGYGVVLLGGGTVTNFNGGTISGSADGIKLRNGGSVTNYAGATIESTGTSMGDCFTGSDCSIFTPSASEGPGYGGGLTLSNAGSIIGNVQMDPTAANVTTLTAGGSIAGDLDIGTNTASTLTLDGDAGTSQLYSQAVTGTTTFTGALTMAGSGTWVIDTDGLSTVSGTTIDAGGTLQIGNGGATGSVGDGDIANGGALVFDRNNALVFTGAISGGGTLTQAGGGTLTLNGANHYVGATEVKAGTLLVGDATHATATIAGDTQVDGGATLGGSGTVGAAGTTTEVRKGGALSPGVGTGSIGTLNVGGDLTLDQGSVLDVDLGAPGTPNAFTNVGRSDSVNVAGTLTFNGGSTLNLADARGMGPGLYNLVSYGMLTPTGCSFSGGTACLTVGTVPGGSQASYFTIVNNAQNQQIDLYNTAGQVLAIWAPNGTTSLGGTGNWSTTSATWTNTKGDGPSAMIPSPGFAIFQGTPGTVTVSKSGGNVTATGMQFAVDGYTLTGDPLTLADDSAGHAPVIEVGDGSSNSTNMTATISNQLLSNGFTKTGGGTLVFVGSSNLTANLSGIESVAVQGGTLQIGSTTAPTRGNPGVSGALAAMPVMAPGTHLALINGELMGGAATAGSAAVTGQDFNLSTQTTGTGASVILGIAATVPGTQPAVGAGAAVDGDGFTATFTGNSAVLAAGATNGAYGSTDTPAITGSGFHVINDSNMGSLAPPGLGVPYGLRYGITGGAASANTTGTAGPGGAGVSGTRFTVENSGGIYGGVGGPTVSGVPGVGGAGISGTGGFTLTNTGLVTGGNGGEVIANGGNIGAGVVTGAGGAGVYSTGGATVINEGTISGGQSGVGLAPADAMDFTGGGNTLELVAGHPGTFNGAIVVTRAAGDTADTLNLGGDSGSDTFDLSKLAADGEFAGFNAEAKSGSSTWTLTGTGATSDNWTIAGGTLNGDATALQGNVAFAPTTGNTAAVLFNQGSSNTNSTPNGAFAGAISGDGSFTKTGDGVLTLTGDNTFTGGTTIGDGTLQIGNGGTAGSIVGNVADDGTLVVNRSDNPVLAGVISGTGKLVQMGTGTTILTGTNTFSGGTTISAGTLQVGDGGASGAIGTGAIVDDGTLVFDRSDAVALPAGLTGHGALIQQGSGTFTVNGDDSDFAGATTIKAGTATVGDDSHAAASLGGMVNISKGATLTGIGTIGGVDLSGTLSPGGSIGALHVTGDATFESGSTFNVEANLDGTADQLAVGGKTTIKGGNTVVLTQPGNWASSTTYVIIASGGGVSGTFSGVSDDQAFLTPTLAYASDAVTLTLVRNDVTFRDVAVTPNEKGVAGGIEGGVRNDLYDAVVKLTATDARNAFDQTSGEYHASQQAERIDDSRFVREAMNQRLRQGDNDPEATKAGHLTAWAHAWGHWGTLDGNGNAANLSDNGDGLLIGADMTAGQARVGITGGASRNTLSVRDRASWGKLTSQWLGGFAGYDAGAFGIRGGIAYAWDQVPSHREVNFPGYADRLSDDATGDTLTGFVEGSWTFHFQNASVSPFFNLAHTRVETDASTEAGGAAALHAYSGSENVSFSTLGVRGEAGFANHLNLHGELGWQHAFGDATPERNLQFASGGPVFTAYGVPIAKNAGLGRIGIGWQRGNVAFSADYEALSGGGMKDQAARLSVNVTF